MLPVERQEKIKVLIKSNKNMKISTLSHELGVSEMTVHRDLKPLIEEGLVIKTFGGITLVHNETPSTGEPGHDECIYCKRVMNEALPYRLILKNKNVEVACCAHCGLLRHQQIADDVLQAMCYDFLRRTTISAPLGWYVMETSLNIGCCQPHVLTFEHKEHAEKFVKGFGGTIFSFEEALNVLPSKMSGTTCCSPAEHQLFSKE